MAGEHLLLLVILAAAILHAQGIPLHRRLRQLRKRDTTSRSLSSFFLDMEKRLDALEASSTNGTGEERLAELEERLRNSTKDVLRDLETRTHGKIRPRLEELEAGLEEIKAMVSELQGEEGNSTDEAAEPGVPLQRDATEAEPAPAAWQYTSLHQLQKLGAAQLCPDHQRLSKLEWELSSLQRWLSARGQHTGETSEAGSSTAASRSSKEELLQLVAGLVNATETRLLSALEERLPLHASPAPPEAPSKNEARKRSCEEYLTSGHYTSGVYTLYLSDSKQPIEVFCDMESAGGGWAVIQRRQDGSEDFYRNWTHFERGFGNLTGEFWLGNDKIHRLTSSGLTRLLVEVENWTGQAAQAYYSTFRVGDAVYSYPLTVSGYYGNKGQDGLTYHSGQKFSTPDRDNDVPTKQHCAVDYKGAWWHQNCYHSNLNGNYGTGNGSHSTVDWLGIAGHLKRAQMKIR